MDLIQWKKCLNKNIVLIGGIVRLSELQSKDIVTMDGKLIGNIIDVIVEEGKIKYLVVEKSKFLLSMFSSKDEMEIKWDQINKIGEDVILISII